MVIVVCTLHLPPNTYEDLLKKRAEQREPAPTWQATMATGKEQEKQRQEGDTPGGDGTSSNLPVEDKMLR